MKPISADSHVVEGEDVFGDLADCFGDEAPCIMNVGDQMVGSEYLDYLEENWDGEGASPIAYVTLVNANRFLLQAAASGLSPEVEPEADGFIHLEWYTSPNCVFSVSFGPSNVIAYSGIFGEDCGVYGTDDISDGVPEAVWAHVRRVVQATPS